MKLKQPWSFCVYRRKKNVGTGNRRDPGWSSFVQSVVEDMDSHPGRGVFQSMEKLLGHSSRERATVDNEAISS